MHYMRSIQCLVIAGVLCCAWLGAWAQPAVTAAGAVTVPQFHKRLTSEDVGVVINTADPYSVEVGEYYATARHIAPGNVVRLDLPVKSVLSASEFAQVKNRIQELMPAGVQAMALAWTQPYAVECNSITSALTVGFVPELCAKSCAPSAPSAYFNLPSVRPFSDLGLRLSMLLAARSVESAKALINRGVASDQQLGKRGVSMASAIFVSTPDTARNVRSVLFPPTVDLVNLGLRVQRRNSTDTSQPSRVIVYETGLVRVSNPSAIDWLAGALADHLTSYGGALLDSKGQMSALDWLEAGATASYGTVSEPCNHLQKFPHPQVLLLNYVMGATAIEAYWRSVAWPTQGVFIGEPLAAPFGR